MDYFDGSRVVGGMMIDDLGVMRWMVNKFGGFSMRGPGPEKS